jgi:hypothetical protein
MRAALLASVLIGAGCFDYDLLQRGFCSSNLTLCDDFESTGPLNDNTTGTATVDRLAPNNSQNPEQAFRGRRSVRFVVPADTAAVSEDTDKTSRLNDPTTDLYLRAFVYFPFEVPAGAATLLEVRDAAGATITAIQLVDGAPRLPGTGDLASPVSANTWYCVELTAQRKGGAFSQIFVDADVTADPPTPPIGQLPLNTLPAFAATRVGLDRTGVMNVSPATVWMDDVVVDTQRIYCKE